MWRLAAAVSAALPASAVSDRTIVRNQAGLPSTFGSAAAVVIVAAAVAWPSVSWDSLVRALLPFQS